MKTLLSTRPLTPETKATQRGWVCISTGELLVAVKNLAEKLGVEVAPEAPGDAKPVLERVKRGPGRPRKVPLKND
jgi:hypothetical protein